MQLIKEKHRSVGKDLNIKIPLGSNINLNGLQQSINDYVERETGLSINPVIDGETFRFTRNIGQNFRFEFYDGIFANTYTPSLLSAGFTQDEIDSQKDVLTKSFFILQIYDSINGDNQTLLHNSYYNGTSFTSVSSIYNIPVSEEFSNIYIPEWFLNETDDNEIVMYGTFLFFNAKFGKLEVFFNKDNESSTSDDKLYNTITLNKSNRNYSIQSNSTTITLKELANPDYVNKLNESLNTFDNEIPQYPTGDQFNNDGTYTEGST